MNQENWKDIEGFNGKYQISKSGDVKNTETQKILTPILKNNYYYVSLYKNSKTKSFRINRLVLLYFSPTDNHTKNICDHKDNNKLNNNIENLQWVTSSENSLAYVRNYKKLCKIIQYDDNNNIIKEWNNVYDILKHHSNYNKNWILRCARDQTKKAYGYTWKYNKLTKKKLNIRKDEIFVLIGNYKQYNFSIYEISNYGNVRNSITKKFMSNHTEEYLKVSLVDQITKKSKSVKIHRLVAEKFVNGKSKTHKYVNHINENKLDNYFKNLEWVTQKQNTIHSIGRKIYQHDPKTNNIINIFNSVSEASEAVSNSKKKYGSPYIIQCCNNKKDLYLGYKWQYADISKPCLTLAEMESSLLQFNQELTILNNHITELEKEYQTLIS